MNTEHEQQVEIVAGPCSITEENLPDIWKIADISVTNLKGERQPAIWGTRTVGLKSRTELNPSGIGMGIDFPVFQENLLLLSNGGSTQDFATPPSVVMASDIVRDTGMVVSTEIMEPHVQIPSLEKVIPDEKALLWSPSVQQLGWPILSMSLAAKRHNWHIGIKNGKWLGIPYDEACEPDTTTVSDLERTWKGLATFAMQHSNQVILIHRGVLVPERGDWRNPPVHEIAKHAKHVSGKTLKLFFDPSHCLGPKLRDHIVQASVDAMLMKDGNDWLYDGLLIETGHSQTDAGQHITVDELQILAQEIAKFRTIKGTYNSR